MNPYLSVFIASIFWTTATQIYAEMGRKISIRRMNLYKSFVSFAFFALFCLFSTGFQVNQEALYYLLTSGLLGFAIGDLFIFYSFSQMGASRTLMLLSFSPSFIAIFSYFLYGVTLPIHKIFGLVFLVGCLFFLTKDKGAEIKFEIKTALIALLGISLDALGVVFTKQAFRLDSTLDSMTANFYRILVACVFLFFLNLIQKVKINPNDVPRDVLFGVSLASFLGTFLALYFYIYGVFHGNEALAAALGSLCPVYASVYEYSKIKKRPSHYFILALISMVLGVALILS
jgi:drug/metabolite transporter (DMT)-like permease